MDEIVIVGAREHNLKDISLRIPRDNLVVFTGISGSGKSSLAFDTIYAEGQRRYVESLSAYARQFLGQLDKPDVDSIEGLSPAISIDQKTRSHNPRSTVGTITEIYDYFRLLYSRVGVIHCPNCMKLVSRQTPQQIVDRILELGVGTSIWLIAPVVRARKGTYKALIDDLLKKGYSRIRVDGRFIENGMKDDLLEDLERYEQHDIDVVVDRIKIKNNSSRRLTESVETCLKLADGLVEVEIRDTLSDAKSFPAPQADEPEAMYASETLIFSQSNSCVECGISVEPLSPRNFSFNSPFGACVTCNGLGNAMVVDEAKIIGDRSLSIKDGVLKPLGVTRGFYFSELVRSACETYNIPYTKPYKSLSAKDKKILLYGNSQKTVKVSFKDRFGAKKVFSVKYEGVVNWIERRYRESESTYAKETFEEFMIREDCPDCNGNRLKKESLAVTIADLNIAQLSKMSLSLLSSFMDALHLDNRSATIAERVLLEINLRIKFLNDVGLNYLSLDRSADTLAGGEAQRIRLASQIGSGLMGVLYVLDEPSIGLHPRDNRRLIETLEHLRDIGNTVIVVEHDEETIRSADFIVDIGPLAGEHGGQVVAAGTLEDILKAENSLTGDYLAGRKRIEVPQNRRIGTGDYIVLRGASRHNLKGIDVEIPLGKLVVVTGVSGSGKSTLVNDLLLTGLRQLINGESFNVDGLKAIDGFDQISKVLSVDQSPIGRTPRSNPATYIGVFDHIRKLFSNTKEARARGYKPGRFSFNVHGGRCDSCSGDGTLRIEMQFLPDVYVPCETCHGSRFNRDTLEILYNNKSISDILNMTVEEAYEIFRQYPAIERHLKTLKEVGLSYIRLGQSAPTLSGGEAQRIKLSSELSKRLKGHTLYILDEPTTGLHVADVKHLVEVLDRLVELGNSVIVIEHNTDVMKCADWIIDLGPDGGDDGGRIIVTGSPEEVSQSGDGYTSTYLAKVLNVHA